MIDFSGEKRQLCQGEAKLEVEHNLTERVP